MHSFGFEENMVLSVSKVLIAFPNHSNFGTERDTSDMHRIKSLDPQEICQFGLVSLSAPKLRRFEMERSILLRLLIHGNKDVL